MATESLNLNTENLAFFGRITASLSHELKNVLATINEYSGLLDDLALAAEKGRPLKNERLRSVCGKIAHQIQRGEVLIQRLNRFSHSADEPKKTVEVQALLSDICDLCDRFARLRQVTLEREIPDRPLPCTLDPFALQFVVQLLLDVALRSVSSSGAQDKVNVALAPEGEGLRLTVTAPGPLDAGARAERQPLLDLLAGNMGAELSWDDARATLILR
jgi:C4-dicarboxylate-specific signal transduction histidine kinase